MGVKWICFIGLISFIIIFSISTCVAEQVTVYENETLSMQCLNIGNFDPNEFRWTVCPNDTSEQCLKFRHLTSSDSGIASGDWVGRASGSLGEACPGASCSHTVEVYGTKLSDERSYYCYDASGNQLDAPSNVVVKVPPTDASISLPDAIIEDQPANITCVTSRVKPADVITVLFTYGSGIDPVPATEFVNIPNDYDDGKTFFVWASANILFKRDDNGKEIACEVVFEERTPVTSQEANLDILFAPYWKDDVPATVFAEFNEVDVELACNDTSNPLASGYRWWKDDGLLDGETSAILIIPRVNDSAIFTNYTCEANNTIGSDSRNIELKKAGPPVLTFLKITDNRTSVALTLEWEVTSTGGFDMENYVIWCKKYSWRLFIECANQSDGQMTSQTVMNLTPNTEYIFVIQGWNSREHPRNTYSTSKILASTPAAPVISMDYPWLSEDVMTVTWFLPYYNSDEIQQNTESEVGVQVIYGPYGSRSQCSLSSYPECTYPTASPWIPVENEKAFIAASFEKKTLYFVNLRIFENGIFSFDLPRQVLEIPRRFYPIDIFVLTILLVTVAALAVTLAIFIRRDRRRKLSGRTETEPQPDNTYV